MKRFARRYTISIKYEPFELFTQGEYFVDAAIHAENFFYSWSELSCAPASWFRVGVVVDRTKALGKFLSDGLITMFLAFGFSIAWIHKLSAALS